jgi:hypothetical protein
LIRSRQLATRAIVLIEVWRRSLHSEEYKMKSVKMRNASKDDKELLDKDVDLQRNCFRRGVK